MTKKTIIAPDYRLWLLDLKRRIRQSQIKAAVRVNTTLLELYWSIGADVVNRQVEEKWGSGVISQLSADLRAEFPDMQGFSTTNLWYIKKWYLFYSQEDIKLHQLGGELKLPAIILPIPWRHYVEIITKCKSVKEALFYARKVSEEGDNPAIGLLICKTKDNVIAEYSLSDIHKPLGISVYDLKNILPKDLQSSLPSVEEVEEELSRI